MKKNRLGFIVVAAMFVLSACAGKDAADPAAVTPDNRLSVEVMTAHPAPFTEHYTVAAVAEPIQSMHLSAEVGGTLSELAVDVGDRVEAGQLLARLDDEPFVLALETARARLDRATVSVSLAQKGYARQKALHAQGSIADSVLEEAELSVRLAEADRKLAALALKGAERDLRHTRIIAPMAGEITRRLPETGTVLAPGTLIFHLSRTDRLRMVVGLSEGQVVHVAEGATADIRFDALPGEPVTGKVVRIGSIDEAGMATFPVEVHIDNPDQRILPGMVGRVTLAGRTIRNAVAVPAVAVRQLGDQTVVYLVRDGIARRAPVSIAALQAETVLIDRGITEGARVVVVGQTALKGGDRVSVAVVDGAETNGGRHAPAVYGLP